MIWISWLLFIIADALFNAWLIKHGAKIYHAINATYRVLISAGFILGFQLWGQWAKFTIFALGGFFSFWFLFNLLLNGLRRLPIDYLGTGSLLDRLERKVPFIFSFWCKLVCSAGFIYLYFHIELL